ncbi:hormogonium polysaccharide biosynthesis protein HpsL [Anabaena sp. UHCC 0451]|uniref:hormogonium polysaccharide biosynthesis protein HpsL n=1 Tax=Anabaena sp. UHCC 0451 TaxID=2055235 RepID=UPI002B2000EC|nr:hormogonium polysaccharide biosynthesis protein HpsL [Anabaena sp. UHCC 0451]MEA5578974.1 hormogonium polysaccharide biosynthesis protein HpsL [Anabaena sp. UHCC 0451]
MAKTKRKSQLGKKQSSVDKPALSLKEELAQKRKATQARKEFTSLVGKLIGSGLSLGMVLFFVGGMKLAAPGALGIIVLTLCYKYPRPALFAFVMYVPFAGTVIYMLGNSPVLQLAKDAFFVPFAIAVWQTCKKQKQPFLNPQAIKTPFWILFSCCMLTLFFINGGQQFNPPVQQLQALSPPSQELPIGLGILGLKVFIGYLPLITCVYYLIRTQQDFWLLSRLQIILIIICCVLGMIQYYLLTIGVCKGTVGVEGDLLFKASLDARCFVGGALLYTPEQGVIRLPGTFVAPWQWAWFLISCTFFTFATIFSDKSILWRLIGLFALVLVFVNAVVCGQRISLALVPVCFVLLLLFTGQFTNLKKFIPLGGGLIVILVVAMAANPTVVQERVDSFINRWNASPPQEFIVSQFKENWRSVDTPIGSGLGRATNSARVLGSTKLVETYYPKVLYEVGIVGVMAFLFFVTSLTIAGFKTYRTIKNRNLRTYGASMWVFVLFISYNTYYYPLDVDPVAVYYWLCAGIIFKLPILDQQIIPEETTVNIKDKKKRLHKKSTFNN